jgi:hypothetical protein
MDSPLISYVPDWSRGCIRGVQGVVKPETGFKRSVGVTGHFYLLEIDGLFTHGSRPGRTSAESVGGTFEMDYSDWSNVIRHNTFDTRSDTESNECNYIRVLDRRPDRHKPRDRRSRAQGECPYDGLRLVGDYESSPRVCKGISSSLANVDLAVEWLISLTRQSAQVAHLKARFPDLVRFQIILADVLLVRGSAVGRRSPTPNFIVLEILSRFCRTTAHCPNRQISD